MKKMLCLVMTVLLVLTLACCGKRPSDAAGEGTDETTVQPEPVLNPLTGLPLKLSLIHI